MDVRQHQGLINKSRLILVGSGAFLLGVIISAVVVSLMWEHYMNRFAAVSAAGAASVDMAMLQCLNTRDTNHAIELLDTSLDGEVMALGGFAECHTSLRHDPELMGVLRRVHDYRMKHPYEESPDGQILMKRAFDLVDEQNGH